MRKILWCALTFGFLSLTGCEMTAGYVIYTRHEPPVCYEPTYYPPPPPQVIYTPPPPPTYQYCPPPVVIYTPPPTYRPPVYYAPPPRTTVYHFEWNRHHDEHRDRRHKDRHCR